MIGRRDIGNGAACHIACESDEHTDRKHPERKAPSTRTGKRSEQYAGKERHGVAGGDQHVPSDEFILSQETRNGRTSCQRDKGDEHGEESERAQHEHDTWQGKTKTDESHDRKFKCFDDSQQTGIFVPVHDLPGDAREKQRDEKEAESLSEPHVGAQS